MGSLRVMLNVNGLFLFFLYVFFLCTKIASSSPGCLSSNFQLLQIDRSLHIGGLYNPRLCISSCDTLYPKDTKAVAVLRTLSGLSCFCMKNVPDWSYLGPSIKCDLLCNKHPCGGNHTFSYYSIYSIDKQQKGLIGLENNMKYSQVKSETRSHTLKTASRLDLLEQMTVLNTITLAIAGLVAAILVLLMISFTLFYLQKQDELNELSSLIPMRMNGKSYGAHNMSYSLDGEEEEIFAKKNHDFKKEGKSKFYNVESDKIPNEERIGNSKFYGSNSFDSEVDDRDGFKNIFGARILDEDQITLTEK